MVNTVLCSITAHAFKQFADAIEAGTPAKQVAQEALAASWKVPTCILIYSMGIALDALFWLTAFAVVHSQNTASVFNSSCVLYIPRAGGVQRQRL